MRHYDVCSLLGHYSMSQLDLAKYQIRINGSRLVRTVRSFLVPDLAVTPVEYFPLDVDTARTLDN